VTLTPHPLLVPWSWKGRAVTLLPLWAVRPVQSLSACIRVTFTLSYISSNTYTCFGRLYRPSSGGTPYVYKSWCLCFLDDCCLGWTVIKKE